MMENCPDAGATSCLEVIISTPESDKAEPSECQDEEEEEEVGTFECVLCESIFSTRLKLQEHFRSHGFDKVNRYAQRKPRQERPSENVANANFIPSNCELCGVTCQNIRNFWQHCRKHHPDWRGLDCAHCGKHFLQKSDYDRHLELHKGEEELCIYQCVNCNNKFYTEEALKIHAQGHEQVHQMEVQLKNPTKKPRFHSAQFRLKASYCKLCCCQFNTSVALAQHLVSHSIFLCLTCGREMNTDQRFREHQKVHLKGNAVSHLGKTKSMKAGKKKTQSKEI